MMPGDSSAVRMRTKRLWPATKQSLSDFLLMLCINFQLLEK